MPARRPPARLAAVLLVGLAAAGPGCAAGREPGLAAERALATSLSGRPQERRLSCESRSACDLLAAHGIAVSEAEFLEALPRSDDPDLGFVGDPDGTPGRLPPEAYGVHEEPVAAGLRARGLAARGERGRDLRWLAAQTDAGRPVIAWVTSGLEEVEATPLVSAAGRPFVAVRGEHSVLVLSARGGRVAYLDPATGRLRRVDAAEFDASWACLGRRAVSAAGRR